ncbi:hypothetical protein VPH35_066413 [Triticum aestivum]
MELRRHGTSPPPPDPAGLRRPCLFPVGSRSKALSLPPAPKFKAAAALLLLEQRTAPLSSPPPDAKRLRKPLPTWSQAALDSRVRSPLILACIASLSPCNRAGVHLWLSLFL